MIKRNGYYFHITRGLCKVNYFGEGASIYFFDKCAEERFTKGAEPYDLKPLSIDQAILTGLSETKEYLLSLRFNHFIETIKKEPKTLLLLLCTHQIDRNIIRFCSKPHYEDYNLKGVSKHFDLPGMIVLRFSVSFSFETEDEEEKVIGSDWCMLSVSQTLFENFDEEAYDIWLEQALNKKQKEINERFDNQISELEKAKKLLVIK
jgi:hypothetical protein